MRLFGYEIINDKELAELSYRFTLSQPITAAVSPGDIEQLRLAIEVERDFKKITPEEELYLRKNALGLKSLFPLK